MQVLDRIAAHLVLQKNNYTCGPCALRHALLVHDKVVSVRRLSKLAGTAYAHGTNEQGLTAAASAIGFKLQHESFSTAVAAQEAIRSHLRDEVPVLLCVDKQNHWTAAVDADSKYVALCDSSRNGPTLHTKLPIAEIITWARLIWRLEVTPITSRIPIFDIYPLTHP